MSIDALTAANAYRNQLKMAQDATEAATADEASQSPFASLLQNALGDAVNAATKSEELQTHSITTGKVELADLVTAVANAELSLNTVVAIRDRVINAYNDIIKMAI